MEGKWCSENCFSSVFDTFGKTRHNFNNLGRAQSTWSNKIPDRESIEHCARFVNGDDTSISNKRTNAKGNARHAVADGKEPCQLRLINREMRAIGSFDALLVQNFNARSRRE